MIKVIGVIRRILLTLEKWIGLLVSGWGSS
jgi:hypothetical protein